MVFSSLYFLYAFLPACFVLYHLWRNKTYQNVVLTAFSLFFYAWGEPFYVSLLIASALVDYTAGLVIERNRQNGWRHAALAASLTANLGILVAFKYSSFFAENTNLLLGTQFDVPKFLLPIGISFYTFQTISYTVDVWRGDVKAQPSFLKFLLFVSLFHQLVAGPIVRYIDVEHDINHRRLGIRGISMGVHRFCIGLFKKVVIANTAGALATQHMALDSGYASIGGSWFGLVMFSLQIYYDFSGYSDMAIGLGHMFGFRYLENFNYPYIARSATEFWRRWHMSLSTFFRDYVYIPLGGNRRRPYLNLFIVWLLTGLWHGASWNFICWGLYFGTFIAIEKLFLGKVLNKLPRFISHLYLLFIAVIGWALFYFEDFGKLGAFLNVLFGQTDLPGWSLQAEIAMQTHAVWLALALVCCMPVYMLARKWLRRIFLPGAVQVGGVLYTVLNLLLLAISTSLLVGSSYNPFLYFRF